MSHFKTAMEGERLVQFTYPGENYPLVYNFKTEAFVNGRRDSDIKSAVCSAQNTTFAEIVAIETARTITTPQVSKVLRMEVVKEKRCLLYKSRKMLKQILEEVVQKVKLNCFHCGKGGHVPKKLESATRKVQIRLTNKRTSYPPSASVPVKLRKTR